MNADLKEIDRAVVDPGLYANPERYHALFRHLRHHEPMRWTAPDGFAPFWLVSRHADIMAAEGAATSYLNAPRAVLKPSEIEDVLSKTQGGHREMIRSMNNMDGDEHRQNRAVTSRQFLLPSVNRMTEEIDAIAVEFVDRLVARAPECDFARDIALWYPLRVIMSLLGVPKEDEARMLELTLQIFNDAPGTKGADKRGTVQAFFDYFRPIVEGRRANPRDDIASKIANAQVNGQPLGDFETFSYFLTVATAGHDTTSSTIAGGLLALIEHPNEMRKLRDNPAHLDTLPDEMMRWVAPVKHFFRTASADCELGGQTVRKGDSLMLAFPSGSRDEAVFDEPDAFRIDRTGNRHLALGSGPHACLGQHLARLEVKQFFKRLIERTEDFALTGPVKRTKSLFISGVVNLPVRFTVI